MMKRRQPTYRNIEAWEALTWKYVVLWSSTFPEIPLFETSACYSKEDDQRVPHMKGDIFDFATEVSFPRAK